MNIASSKPTFNHLLAEEQTVFTLDTISKTCAVQTTFVMSLIEEGVLAPIEGQEPKDWKFTSAQLRCISITARLQRDLGVNAAGAALAIQLLDEIETLRAQLDLSAMKNNDDENV